MKHVKTLSSNTLKNSMKKGGCGECQTSCQSACKTSCTTRAAKTATANGGGLYNQERLKMTPTVL